MMIIKTLFFRFNIHTMFCVNFVILFFTCLLFVTEDIPYFTAQTK